MNSNKEQDSVFLVVDTSRAAENISFESILETYNQFRNEHPVIVESVICAPSTFKKLNRSIEDEQAELEKDGVKTMPKEDIWLTSFYGLKVVVDPDMKPGTWKFEERSL